jgi:hypothetical protein
VKLLDLIEFPRIFSPKTVNKMIPAHIEPAIGLQKATFAAVL